MPTSLTNSAGASRSGFFVRVLIALAAMEWVLLLSTLLGPLISLILVLAIAPLRPDWEMNAYLEKCNPSVDGAVAMWVDSQRMEGLDVSVVKLAADDATKQGGGDVRYKILYRQINWPDIIKIWVFPDAEQPLPTAFHTLCTPRAYDFGGPGRAGYFESVFLLGWYAAILLLVSLRSLRNRGVEAKPISRNTFNLSFAARWSGLGMSTAIAVFAITALIQRLGIYLDTTQTSHLVSVAGSNLMLLVLIVSVGPICEELLFRGWFLRRFISIGAPRLGTILVSSSFTAMHWIGVYPVASTAIYYSIVFALSLVLSLVYLRTRNVWACALAHATHNLLSMTIVLLA